MSLADSPYRTAISGSVLKLQESGKLRELKKKWWSAWKPNNTNCEVNSLYGLQNFDLTLIYNIEMFIDI